MAQKCDVSKAIVRSELIIISLFPIDRRRAFELDLILAEGSN